MRASRWYPLLAYEKTLRSLVYECDLANTSSCCTDATKTWTRLPKCSQSCNLTLGRGCRQRSVREHRHDPMFHCDESALSIVELIPVLSVVVNLFLRPRIRSCDLAHPLEDSWVCHDSVRPGYVRYCSMVELRTYFVG